LFSLWFRAADYTFPSCRFCNVRYVTIISLQMYVDVWCTYIEVVQNASGPLLVEIDKLPGNPLGITLTQGCYRGRRVLYIDSVAPASIADRSVTTFMRPSCSSCSSVCQVRTTNSRTKRRRKTKSRTNVFRARSNRCAKDPSSRSSGLKNVLV